MVPSASGIFIQSQVGTWDEAVDLAGCNLARELGWCVRSGLALGTLGGLVFFFVRGNGLGDLAGDLVGRPVELPHGKQADDEREGDEQLADDADDVPEDVWSSFSLSEWLERCVHPFVSSTVA